MTFEDALREIERVTGGTITHINRGESEDMMRGFNAGYEDAEAGFPHRRDDAPADEPWRSAYRRGYADGWETWREHNEGDGS